jgi:hypothetical protein
MIVLLDQPSTSPAPLAALIYVSRSNSSFDPLMLTDIESKSEDSNRLLSITGLLLYKFGIFMQYLEGPTAAVEELLARIAHDSRHHSLVILHQGECNARLFPYWGMRSMNFHGLRQKLNRDYYSAYLIFLLSFIEETTNYSSPITLKTSEERQEYIGIVEELLNRALFYCPDSPEALKADSGWQSGRSDQIITPLRDAQSIVRLLGNELWGFRLVDLQLQFAFASAQAQKQPLPTPFSVVASLKVLKNWLASNGY